MYKMIDIQIYQIRLKRIGCRGGKIYTEIKIQETIVEINSHLIKKKKNSFHIHLIKHSRNFGEKNFSVVIFEKECRLYSFFFF